MGSGAWPPSDHSKTTCACERRLRAEHEQALDAALAKAAATAAAERAEAVSAAIKAERAQCIAMGLDRRQADSGPQAGAASFRSFRFDKLATCARADDDAVEQEGGAERLYFL